MGGPLDVSTYGGCDFVQAGIVCWGDVTIRAGINRGDAQNDADYVLLQDQGAWDLRVFTGIGDDCIDCREEGYGLAVLGNAVFNWGAGNDQLNLNELFQGYEKLESGYSGLYNIPTSNEHYEIMNIECVLGELPVLIDNVSWGD